MMSQAIEYVGRCHCGTLTARYRTSQPPANWSVRACQCSFCRAHGAHTTSDPAGTLAFKCTDPSRVQRYRFAGRLADFLICSECGVYLGARLETAKGAIGILNINTLRPLPAPLPAPEPMDYGGESAEARQLRRSTRWTPLAPESL